MFLKFTEILEVQQNNTCTFTSGTWMIYIHSPFYEAIFFVNYMFVHREIRRVPLVEHAMLTLPDNLGSSPVFSALHVAQPLVAVQCFVDHCCLCCPSSFCHYIFCPSQTYGFWLPLWCLQAFLDNVGIWLHLYLIYYHSFVHTSEKDVD